jgi:hypothetical protein
MSNSEFYYDGTNDRWISEVPLYAEIKPRGGSATQAPMTFTSGTVLTTPAAGVLEYNGQFFVTGNTTTKRALVSSKHLYSLTSTRSLTTSAGTVSVFNVSLALEANTVYEFEIWFGLTAATSVSGSNTAISCSVAIPSSSTGSFEATSSSGTSTSSATRDFATNQSGPLTATSVTYSGTSSTATGQYHIKGIVRTSSTASSFTPNVIITNNTNALTSLTVLAGSYASVSKIGAANANIVTGAWT